MKFLSLFIKLSLIFTPFLHSSNGHPLMEKIPEKDQIVMEVMNEASQEIRNKYSLSPAGFGMNHGFEHISISFELFENKPQNELRKILLDSTQIFLQKINESEKMRSILSNYPVTEKNIGIDIYIRGKEKKSLFHPNFFCASISSGELSYLTRTEENRFVIHQEITETYQEALDLSNKQPATVTQGENP